MRRPVVALAILATLVVVLETKAMPEELLLRALRGVENWQICPANEEWTPCGRCGEPRCDMLHPAPCHLMCRGALGPKSFSGCRCNQGLVRKENRCIPPGMC